MTRARLILQFTDLHLFADRTRQLKGITPWETFERVLATARHRHPEPDLVVFTGDLTHDELPETYHQLREHILDWLPICRFLPGNHDSRTCLRAAFPECTSAGEGTLQFATSLDNWRLIGLDTHLPGQVSGRLGAEQLQWLDDELKRLDDSLALVFQHHPPCSVQTPWLDAIGLEDADQELRVLSQCAALRGVVTGHVHHEAIHSAGSGVSVYTTPATAVQFAPGADVLTVDPVPPGYRVLRLTGDHWQTYVERA